MAFPNEKQKIHFVTGKGGVGKSTVAAALAQKFAKNGEKTLLVELGEQSYFQNIYEKPITYMPTLIAPNFHVALWGGEACLKEYVYHLIKVKKIVDLFFENRIMRTFLRAAPALRELAILGKITSGIRKWGPPLEFDTLVVDAYSTGHFLALLRSPVGMGELIESGPMGEQSRAIQKVLSTSHLCEFHIVTLAEELSVTEAIELQGELEKIISHKAKIICNRIYQLPIPTEQLPSEKQIEPSAEGKKFIEFLYQLLLRQDEQVRALREKVRCENSLPYVLSVQNSFVVDELAAALK